MGNSYCKINYSESEANVVEITQKGLQKMKKNEAMVDFFCLVSKIWGGKNSILCCYKKEKTTSLCSFLSAKN